MLPIQCYYESEGVLVYRVYIYIYISGFGASSVFQMELDSGGNEYTVFLDVENKNRSRLKVGSFSFATCRRLLATKIQS